ncbi:MoxR family ATPase [Mumia zhuanghuii]|uniref:MoxR family ATPase n=1 Tax=Mumia zhuanghuii TaxID=2585211 RepID=A0A5C4MDD7_9ACTN|nr:MoxR family ATPase [Mumia zhuanghuii]TNC38132.1 MoxR family ATPase [Mumia zhuanghuii]
MTTTSRREPAAPPGQDQTDELVAAAGRLAANIESVIVGKTDVVRTAVIVLLAGGHLLLEDVPGVGKTMLSKALARSIDGSMRRIQFTPDLLPSDVTGTSVWDPESRTFEFRPGAVFGNVVVGDEINRASPKTQSALLECMEERQVTVDSTTYPLEDPFMVVATQNPLEMEGTYPLPEAQRDRFMARVSMGYPSAEAEASMLREHGGSEPLADLAPVTDVKQVADLVATVRTVHVAPAIEQYAVALTHGTRSTSRLRLGASPRATLHLVRAARARAALDRRPYVLPDDVSALAEPVLAHRLLLSPDAVVAGWQASDVVREVLSEVRVPEPGR